MSPEMQPEVDENVRLMLVAEVAAIVRDFQATTKSDPYLAAPYTSVEHAIEAFRRIALGLAERILRRPRPLVFDDTSVFIDIVQSAEGALIVLPMIIAGGAEVDGVQALHAQSATLGNVLATIGILQRASALRPQRHVIVQVQSRAGMFRRAALNVPVLFDRTLDIRPSMWEAREPPLAIQVEAAAKMTNAPGSTMIN